MILDDRIISAKKIAETPALSWESVGYINHEILYEKALSQKGSQMSQCWPEEWPSACFTSHFVASSCGIFEPSCNYGWNLDPYTSIWSRD
jgi:hypothetical protein